ncbi:hypothetical protein JW977_00760 [Candidatus Falkowbacteria bacterium]|nr:hypothetical protein [Candidatus Falkowbacteria bacterium]
MDAKERKVKGALMVALAMMVRSMKDLDWLERGGLTQADMNLIREGILSSRWYDATAWERMGIAVFKLIGNSQPENAYQFGYGILAETLLKVYKGPLRIEEPIALLTKIATLYGTVWYNFGSAEFESKKNSGIFKITHPDGVPIPECFVPMSRGFLKRLTEESEGKKVIVICMEDGLANFKNLTTLTLSISWE